MFNFKFKPFISVVLIALCTPLFCQSVDSGRALFYNPYTTLAQLHSSALAQQMVVEGKKDLELIKSIAEKTTSLKPFDIAQLRVNPVEQLSLTYALFAANATSEVVPNILTENTIRELGLFSTNGTNAQKTLFEALDNTQTTFGKVQLQKMLLEPSDNSLVLEERQLIIKTLIDNEPLLNEITTHLEKIKQSEHIFFWFWKLSSAPTIEEFNQHAGPFFNNSPFARQMWRAMASFMNLLTVGISTWGTGMLLYHGFINLNRWNPDYHYQLPLGFTCLAITLWSSAYFLSNGSKTRSNVNTVHATMNQVATFINSCINLGDIVGKNKHLHILFPDSALLKNVFSSDQGKELIQLLSSPTFTSKPSVLSFQGRAQVAFKLLSELKDQMTKSLVILGQLDAYASIAKLYDRATINPKTPFCFPIYAETTTPSLTLDKVWLPGTSSSSDPRTTSVAVLMAQSLGIAPAQNMTLTPFNKISSSMKTVTN